GTSEGAVVAAAASGVDDAARLTSTAESARDAINPSPAAIAAGAATTSVVPSKEGPAIATGGDNVTLNAGRIIIQVPLPK
ncbi:MAG: hypothetical protein HOQ34_05575, partial [Gemmatimonadaceae bacterium]|nr:hypothetical protein [Gemmatimonadaceae bacterium]